ncbi:glycerol-3-phosphate dehydrogenase subunit GlpB [Bacteroides pyogenes]|uniref:glycerol-3-phosphate dehydrogenase subunit GlpB n=1 Tax=Bacteroides pyogenes TaxID=310300 RepID=UPI000E17A43F|nr:glycerol-3-phosphate dehydrogenase subunit GlpB [Bacteroides pyogenes]MBB3895318.1 glycerol-3-phosphate dehydrogenase subunit B [Bacteroides pyogenes]SUV70694.1 Anaerobic glycerol-3-phosphate dehydrogenase subunit B [Bacteroides pyogenes]
MKFDTVIIGGGLAGLVCGIKLCRRGKRCAIVSSGQSALHFSSGSFDLLNYMPDGTPVSHPVASIDDLIARKPFHPYSKLGKERFESLVKEAEGFFTEAGIDTVGSYKENHYRISAMGELKPTWKTLSHFAVAFSDGRLPWKKAAIFNMVGFLDFYPEFIASELSKRGVSSEIRLFALPGLEDIQQNPSEFRSTNVAKALDKEEYKDQLIQILKDGSRESDVIIFPAFVGLSNDTILKEMEDAVGKPILLLPTLPPSIAGIKTQQHLCRLFRKEGGTFMLGDTILKGDTEGNFLRRVFSKNHGDIPFVADHFVLATGSYFSQGLIASRDRVYEPVFDLDVDYLHDRQEWYNDDVFESQNYMQFGVRTNHRFQALRSGLPIENLYVIGAGLEGFSPLKEGSGAGVSILTALHVADTI